MSRRKFYKNHRTHSSLGLILAVYVMSWLVILLVSLASSLHALLSLNLGGHAGCNKTEAFETWGLYQPIHELISLVLRALAFWLA